MTKPKHLTQGTVGIFFRRLFFFLLIVTVISIPILWHYASNLTEAEAAEWKMWINLFKNGWADPMRPIDPETGQEDVKWYEWHRQITPTSTKP